MAQYPRSFSLGINSNQVPQGPPLTLLHRNSSLFFSETCKPRFWRLNWCPFGFNQGILSSRSPTLPKTKQKSYVLWSQCTCHLCLFSGLSKRGFSDNYLIQTLSPVNAWFRKRKENPTSHRLSRWKLSIPKPSSSSFRGRRYRGNAGNDHKIPLEESPCVPNVRFKFLRDWTHRSSRTILFLEKAGRSLAAVRPISDRDASPGARAGWAVIGPSRRRGVRFQDRSINANQCLILELLGDKMLALHYLFIRDIFRDLASVVDFFF